MFKYEEYDLPALLNDPDIDPDSAEALYAQAQFYKLGKGTPVDLDAYRAMLGRAAEEGSEPARAELAAETEPEPAAAQPAELPPLPDSLTELKALADRDDGRAVWEMAARCRKMGDTVTELAYLRRADSLFVSGRIVYDQSDAIALYTRTAEILDAQDDAEAAHDAYCKAADMGGVQACKMVERDLREGRGCEQNDEQADVYMLRAAHFGGEKEKLAAAVALQKAGTRMQAAIGLEEVLRMTTDVEVRNLCALLLAEIDGRPVDEEAVRWALSWSVEKEDAWAKWAYLQLTQWDVFYGACALYERARKEAQNDIDKFTGLPMDKDIAELLYEDAGEDEKNLRKEYGGRIIALHNSPEYAELQERQKFWCDFGAKFGSERLCLCKAAELSARASVLQKTDPAKALELYREAAELGDTAQQKNVAAMLLETDPQKALAYSREHGLSGYEKLAQAALCEAQGDLPGAFAAYQGAADLGIVKGEIELARCYTQGLGTERDLVKAKALMAEVKDGSIVNDRVLTDYKERHPDASAWMEASANLFDACRADYDTCAAAQKALFEARCRASLLEMQMNCVQTPADTLRFQREHMTAETGQRQTEERERKERETAFRARLESIRTQTEYDALRKELADKTAAAREETARLQAQSDATESQLNAIREEQQKARRAEQERKAEEARLAAEKKAEQERAQLKKLFETLEQIKARRAEEERIAAEKRKIEEAKKAEEERIAAEKRRQEEARKAEAERIAQEKRRAEAEEKAKAAQKAAAQAEVTRAAVEKQRRAEADRRAAERRLAAEKAAAERDEQRRAQNAEADDYRKAHRAAVIGQTVLLEVFVVLLLLFLGMDRYSDAYGTVRIAVIAVGAANFLFQFVSGDSAFHSARARTAVVRTLGDQAAVLIGLLTLLFKPKRDKKDRDGRN